MQQYQDNANSVQTDQQYQVTEQVQNQPVQPEVGPRKISFFVLIIKTFFGFAGGVVGSLILLGVSMLASSILQPVLMPSATTADQINPVFMVVLMGMIFITTLVSSLVTPYLLSISERDRYPKIASAIYQIFILNLVIFAFTAPLYLTTSVTNLEFTAYAAGLQIILVSTASALIMEIVNDQKYPLLAVYTTLLAILVSTAVNLFLYQMMKSTTVLLFAALPLTWMMIGFFQGVLAMMYNWYYINWGIDFLAAETVYGVDYAATEQAEEEAEAEEEKPVDKDGGDFLKS
jgi:hypothetical protein